MYQVINSQINNLPVPKIDGVLLHSEYDPVQEAQNYIHSVREKIQGKTTVLVLGLGFGYHIRELQKVFTGEILVIEPNVELAQDYISRFGESFDILGCSQVTDLFSDEPFVRFLQTSPAVLCHQNSFNLNPDFYKGLLRHKATKQTSEILPYLNTNTLDFIDPHDEAFDQEVKKIMTINGASRGAKDFYYLALNSIKEGL